MKEQIIGAAQYFYTRIEKRSLPLEASKALVGWVQGKNPRDIAFSLLERTKKHVSLWIEDSSQVRIYKRFFGELLKREELTLLEAFSPFVLINCWESFYELLIEKRSRRSRALPWIREFFRSIEVDELLEIRDRKELIEKIESGVGLAGEHSFFVATHIAYMIDPNFYIPITPAVGRVLETKDADALLRLVSSLRKNRIKPIEAFVLVNLLYEDTPSKRRGLDSLLGIDRERELLLKAQKLWNKGKFWNAHEVLEEVWEYVGEKEKKERYQGLIRLAIALHHNMEGKRKKALNVLFKALPQLSSATNMEVNVRELALFAEEMAHKLKNGESVRTYPEMKVV